jgi:zinc protease
MEWFTEELPFTLENRMKSCIISELLNRLYEKTIREENSSTYDCSADYYLIRGEKDDCQIGFSADCSMESEKCDSVLLMMKQGFADLPDNITQEMFISAKESMLKSCDELIRMKNGFWLDAIWQKEHRNIDLYTNRRKTIEAMTLDEVVSYLKKIQANSHFCETIMIGEQY